MITANHVLYPNCEKPLIKTRELSHTNYIINMLYGINFFYQWMNKRCIYKLLLQGLIMNRKLWLMKKNVIHSSDLDRNHIWFMWYIVHLKEFADELRIWKTCVSIRETFKLCPFEKRKFLCRKYLLFTFRYGKYRTEGRHFPFFCH